MSNKVCATLWKITSLAIVGLLIVTFILAYQAVNLPQTGLYGKLTSSNPTIYLYSEPSTGSKVVTILEGGGKVYVTDIVTQESIEWVKIRTGRFSGWLSKANIAFEGQ
jgi:uncharacterized protein YgiM (DUF1202 family)